VRTYVLLKPPFLTEAEAIADSIATINYASKVSDTVSLNPVNVQKGTLVEKMWRNWSYRPPWLWSVLEVLKASSGRAKRLVCEPTGGGRERGAHNCGKCDDAILSSIKAFSESQDPSRLGWPECSCREIWSGAKEIEGYAMGGPCDLQRLSRRARA
jgi:radical SAM enzyme (TIGR01210 family)